MPKPEIAKVGKRIMSLSEPTKNDKSASEKGDIYLVDSLSTIRKKIMSAVTDSGSEVKIDLENKPGITNLLTIYASLADISLEKS